MFTVGPVQENCYIVRRKDDPTAVIVDPGDEAEQLLTAVERLGIETVEAILVTHTHFDHVGAVAPVAKATKAPVYCPELETQVLANIMDYVPWPGFGPFESYHADHTVAGGETLALAEHEAMFSGDVLFQGSVGRVDLPGGDWPTLLASIENLIDAYPAETTVFPGHMGVTTLG